MQSRKRLDLHYKPSRSNLTIEAWRTLSPEQKDAISHLITVMKK